MGTPGRAAGI